MGQETLLEAEKELLPVEILEQAIRENEIKKLVGMFSGGKDSQVTCLETAKLAKELNIPFEVVHCSTGVGVKETFQHVLKICGENNWRLHVTTPLPHETYRIFIHRFGFPGPGIHNAVMGFLKWHPLRKWCREHKTEGIGLISGRRRKESARRAKMRSFKTPIVQAEPNMLMVSPLYYKPDEWVWNYIRENNLEICPVYKTLHISGDCLCGAFAEEGERELIRIFHPDEYAFLEAIEKEFGGRWGWFTNPDKKELNASLERYLETVDETDSVMGQEFVCADCFIDNRIKQQTTTKEE